MRGVQQVDTGLAGQPRQSSLLPDQAAGRADLWRLNPAHVFDRRRIDQATPIILYENDQLILLVQRRQRAHQADNITSCTHRF
ncbi:MAG: hypothetical protein A2W35_07640 [Chloroflexi bacterium RBG_16_57_11]|nr:MAG: hypothetical protein A2W35_07640 [Chloroflexi bacterium RBG_16_57_11]